MSGISVPGGFEFPMAISRFICAYCHTEKSRAKCMNCGASLTIRNRAADLESKKQQELALYQAQQAVNVSIGGTGVLDPQRYMNWTNR